MVGWLHTEISVQHQELNTGSVSKLLKTILLHRSSFQRMKINSCVNTCSNSQTLMLGS